MLEKFDRRLRDARSRRTAHDDATAGSATKTPRATQPTGARGGWRSDRSKRPPTESAGGARSVHAGRHRRATRRRSRQRMSFAADKTLFLCSCNGTMPLDGDALGARARAARRSGRAHDAVPARARRASPRARKAMSWSRARRSSGCWATSPRKAARRRRSVSSTSARPAAGRPRRATRRPRSRRCWRWRRCPTPIRCRASATSPAASC